MFSQNFSKLTKVNNISSIKYNKTFDHIISTFLLSSFLLIIILTVLFFKRTGQASYLTRERRQARVSTMDRVMNITSTSPVSSDRHILARENNVVLSILIYLSEPLMQQGVKVELQLMLFQLVWSLLAVC